jgi:hypothetical protein
VGAQHLLRRHPALFEQTVHISRSASVSRTIYFFGIAQLSLVGHTLRIITRKRYPNLEV